MTIYVFFWDDGIEKEIQRLKEMVLGDPKASILFEKSDSLTFAFFYENFFNPETKFWKAVVGFRVKTKTSEDIEYLLERFSSEKMKYKYYITSKCVYSSLRLRSPKAMVHWWASSKFFKALNLFLEQNKISKFFWESLTLHLFET